MARVMIVDDDADSREVIARFLRNAGHAVSEQSSGQDALANLSAETPDVIILDYRMPAMDGLSFLDVLRCYLRWQNLPVIMVTAYAQGNHIRRALELGVRKTFLKSELDLNELAEHVEACAPVRNLIGPSGDSSIYLH